MAASSGAWLEAVRQVVAAVRASDVTDLEVANAQFSVRVRREPGATRAAATLEDADHAASHLHRVLAPFTGVFYRSPTPSAHAYAAEGDWVDADAVVGLIETMKTFNEIAADVSGRVVGFSADNGQVVHAGDVLVSIEPGVRATADAEPHP